MPGNFGGSFSTWERCKKGAVISARGFLKFSAEPELGIDDKMRDESNADRFGERLIKILDRLWFRLRFRTRGFCGRLLNAAGLPGFVRHDQRYEFAGIKVRTTVGRWSTKISVNGVRVEFARLTGAVTGIEICFPSPELLKAVRCKEAVSRAPQGPV